MKRPSMTPARVAARRCAALAVALAMASPAGAPAQTPTPPLGGPGYPPAPFPPYPPPSYARASYGPPGVGPPFRPFTLGLGLGVGGLLFHDGHGRAREGGLSYTLRAGFGVTRGWLVFLGVEGTGTNHMTFGVWQTAYLLGTQYFVLDRLYLRAGFGLARATAADGLSVGGTGAAFMAAAGLELAQGTSTSLALEPSVTAARQGNQTWSNFGLNFVLSFY
jgi:hypothetical protein